MSFKFKYRLCDIPSELIMATYNGVSEELFTFEDFADRLRVKNFLEVIDRNGDINIKTKIDKLEAKYKKDFKVIIKSHVGEKNDAEYNRKLRECHDKAGNQFRRLTNQYQRHIKFYKKLEENLDEYVNNGVACIVCDEYTSVVVIKGNVIATYTNNLDKKITFTKIYDKEIHENAFNTIMGELINSNAQENV